MKKYAVVVVRIGYGFATIEVNAGSVREARIKAIDEAGNHYFSEKTAEYKVNCLMEVKDEKKNQ